MIQLLKNGIIICPHSTSTHAAEQVKRVLLYSKLNYSLCMGVGGPSCMTNQIFMQLNFFAVFRIFSLLVFALESYLVA
jgi:hypothetical protein